MWSIMNVMMRQDILVNRRQYMITTMQRRRPEARQQIFAKTFPIRRSIMAGRSSSSSLTWIRRRSHVFIEITQTTTRIIREVKMPELLKIRGRIRQTEPIIVLAQEKIVFIEEFSRCLDTKLLILAIDSTFSLYVRFGASRISST